MENVITQKSTQLTEAIFNEDTNRWKNADVLALTHHFHKLDENQGQYERVNYFAMRKSDVKQFNTIQKIKTLSIYLALKAGYKEKFTFFPIFEVTTTQGEKLRFDLEPHQKPKIKDDQTKLTSEIVPKIFKDMICENWEEVEMSLVDDLFTVKTKGKPMERVLYYIVSANLINPYLPGNISELKLYPGIDMNKFQYKDMISFTPVIGVIPKTPIANSINSMGIIESADDEVYLEYLSPCPPTCGGGS